MAQLTQAKDYQAEQWELLDIEIEAKEKIDDPFGLEINASFTHPSGETLDVPGFYNGENKWVIRFCPPQIGEWKYETRSAMPALNGKSGTISVSANTNPSQHGPLVVSETDPQRFSYADGTPYFLLAFELDWLFALDWDNAHDIPKTRQIVSHVAENKFNHVIMNVYAYDAGGSTWPIPHGMKPEHDFSKPKTFPFGGDNDHPDFSTLNVDFFKHLDRVMSHLNEQQIVAHLMIYVWNKKVNWPTAESDADNLYFDYVVKRYQAYPNLVWDISKEALGYGHNDISYITNRIERLKKIDAYNRLLTVHDYRYCSSFPDQVDFISAQKWTYDIYTEMHSLVEKHAQQPVFNIEHGGYESSTYNIFNGAYEDAVTCLDRNYKIIFAGAYSTYYWQNASWDNIIYNPLELPKENQPKFEYYKYLATLFERYPFETLRPIQKDTTTFALSDNESLVLYYIPENMNQVTCGHDFMEDKLVEITWFDPLAGRFEEPYQIDYAREPWSIFRRPENAPPSHAIAILKVMD